MISDSTGNRPAGTAPDREALEHVRRITKASGTSFFWAMRLLTERRRDAMFAIYAFCREIDDIADEEAPTADKITRLNAWRDEIDRLYEGQPRFPISRALAGPLSDYNLEKADFLALIEGMEMDATRTVCAPTMAELEYYCDRVACAVGRLSVKAFGATEPEAVDVAFALGQALQLTNILRDPLEDAERDRLYLPSELLLKHGIGSRDPRTVLSHPSLPDVCRDLADVADRRFDEADAALAKCARQPMRPAIVMKEIYHRYLEKLMAGGWRDLSYRGSLSGPEKLWIGLRYGLL
ncbi:MAG: presqualene diphosphate synthase HpnD [Alphaproteobacteria bacterium]|nr:presqualene diphosphate synthase HpnD [Alphaproteobacteria bacterium]